MNNKIKNTLKTSLPLAILLANSANADVLRTRFEINNNLTYKTTFGIGKDGTQFSEWARLYYLKEGINLGFKLPEFNFQGIKNKTGIFGEISDNIKYGGFESTFSLPNKYQVTLNGEYSTTNDYRLGVYGQKNFNNLDLGLAFDTRKLNGKKENQYFTNGIYDLNPKNTIGFALVYKDKNQDTIESSFVYGHHKDWWGTRLFLHPKHNLKSKDFNLNFALILTKNPTFGKKGETFLVDRGQDGDDIHNLPLGNLNGPFTTERTPTLERTKEGPVFEIKGNSKGFLAPELGYRLDLKKWKIGASGYGDSNGKFGGSALINYDKYFKFETRIDNKEKYFGIQINIPLN